MKTIVFQFQHQAIETLNLLKKINRLIELRSQNDIELSVKYVRKKGIIIEMGDGEYEISDFNAHKKERLKELKSAHYHNLEDLIYRMQFTHDEIIDVLDQN